MNLLDQLKNEMAVQSGELDFKSEWIQHLHANLPLYSRLPAALQDRLHQKIAEFITTTSFEKPKQFKKKHPSLYAELQTFYQLDPATWF